MEQLSLQRARGDLSPEDWMEAVEVGSTESRSKVTPTGHACISKRNTLTAGMHGTKLQKWEVQLWIKRMKIARRMWKYRLVLGE